MLDSDTKRRIDSARDILVGKLPDPKAQVEQITIALIFKFMDDMDKQAQSMGGKATFFTGEYQKYAWSKIFDPRIGGFELVGLYGEAIQRMNQNPKIPQLFRDIFKNAYLPYRDPETLKAFLKTINEFEYDHSERLGDAFEYLLSVMGSQGDAGQFRTPRHIIDFIVKIVDPKKDEQVLDPACGTAGFLISAYKHILEENKKDGRSTLTPKQRRQLMSNFTGYDISPDMVRLSLVNLYLHGFTNPSIFEYDTLTSEEKWNEHYQVILANPPFMTPKGGIRPHKRFSVQANRSEVLFVDYIHEHLNPNGRAGIIVPEGIIFQSGGAYQQLRKMLLEQSLYAVVSLPAGVFNPYSGVKTSILLLDKSLAKRTKEIVFVRVDNDGFGLGAQRRESKENDLPIALEIVRKFREAMFAGKNCELLGPEQKIAVIVEKKRIEESDDYNFSGERYRETINYIGKWPLEELGKIVNILNDKPPTYDGKKRYYSTGAVTGSGVETYELVDFENRPSRANLYPSQNDVGFAVMKGTNKVILIDETLAGSIFSTGFTFLRCSSAILPKYLLFILCHEKFQSIKDSLAVDGIMGGLRKSDLREIRIPLPPLDVQQQIVEELERYQNIIDGARKVVDNYKPSFKIDPEWETIELEKVVEIQRGGSPRPINEYLTKDANGVNWIKIGDTKGVSKYIFKTKEKIKPEGAKRSRAVKEGDFILSNSMSFGRPYIMRTTGCIHDGWLLLRIKSENLNQDYLYYILSSDILYQKFKKAATGGVVNNLNIGLVNKVTIPLPNTTIQEKIVAFLEKEKSLVDANLEIIELFEKKIEEIIETLWGKQ